MYSLYYSATLRCESCPVDRSGVSPLKKLTPPLYQMLSNANSSSAGEELPAHLSSSNWDVVCIELVHVLCMLSALWVHMCNNSLVVSGKQPCWSPSLPLTPKICMLLFLEDPWAWRRGTWYRHPKWDEHYVVSYSLHVDCVWVSLLIAIYCKKMPYGNLQ